MIHFCAHTFASRHFKQTYAQLKHNFPQIFR